MHKLAYSLETRICITILAFFLDPLYFTVPWYNRPSSLVVCQTLVQAFLVAPIRYAMYPWIVTVTQG